jgi:hypothetical protein
MGADLDSAFVLKEVGKRYALSIKFGRVWARQADLKKKVKERAASRN